MGKHSRPGPPNQPSRAVPRAGGHLRPDEPRVLEEWNGFSYEPAGTAPSLAEAQRWVNEQTTSADNGESAA
ncbi:DUF6087 family protein [Streptomyces sp. NPDC059850]|uniref:DUF6087 family protein n=1 Tax=Streptomyces sp. NPDC059850 TaxID=3346970 RepID=UPI0036622456